MDEWMGFGGKIGGRGGWMELLIGWWVGGWVDGMLDFGCLCLCL